jgi:hypothetical protein
LLQLLSRHVVYFKYKILSPTSSFLYQKPADSAIV